MPCECWETEPGLPRSQSGDRVRGDTRLISRIFLQFLFAGFLAQIVAPLLQTLAHGKIGSCYMCSVAEFGSNRQ
jgi:hypothetical protein